MLIGLVNGERSLPLVESCVFNNANWTIPLETGPLTELVIRSLTLHTSAAKPALLFQHLFLLHRPHYNLW